MSFPCRSLTIVALRYARRLTVRNALRPEWRLAGGAPAAADTAVASDSAVVIGRIVAGPLEPAGEPSVDALTVKVAGTDVSSAVDGLGHFTLQGVPPGDVQLQFAGGDTQAVVVIPGVESGDQIDLALRMIPRTPEGGW